MTWPGNTQGLGRHPINADPAIGVAWAPPYEHFHQYVFAGSLVAGRRVLAVEQGRADDALLLATRANEVVVVSSGSAPPKATTPHNATFLHGDLLQLSESAAGRFDVVTCFDAPGGPSDLSKLLGETARVLVPGGILLVSSQTLSAEELTTVVAERFPHHCLWGQTPAIGSLLTQLDSDATHAEVERVVREEGRWRTGVKVDADGYLAVASLQPLPPLPSYAALVDVSHELLHDFERQCFEALESGESLRRRYDDALVALRREQRANERYARQQRQLAEDARGAMADAELWRAHRSELERSFWPAAAKETPSCHGSTCAYRVPATWCSASACARTSSDHTPSGGCPSRFTSRT